MEIECNYKQASWEQETKLVINKRELEQLQKAILPAAKKCKAKLEKYQSYHESGEATSKQEDILIELEQEYATFEHFLEQKIYFQR